MERKKATAHLFVLAGLTLLSMSCENTKVLENKHGMIMKFDPPKIDDIKEIPWRVGDGVPRRQEISKGLLITVKLPKINRKELNLLYKKGKVDSWIVKIERNTILKKGEFIGHFAAPFKVQTSGERISSVSETRFRIYYAAASLSPRLQRFRCPAFNHNMRLNGFHLSSVDQTPKSLIVQYGLPFSGKVESAGFIPIGFNGGITLKGDYMIFVALYSSTSKRPMSRYIPIKNILSVTKERNIQISGCGGFNSFEKRKKRGLRFEDLKFN
ncbi:MAG: hypothetical protein OXB88_00370 [Bacteriovoracales bacterium]|nr:hypothetical protein [Bacteriovoracales bacterium]